MPVSPLARLRDRDHTRGSLFVSIAVLSIPSILTSLGGFGLFQLVDLRFLGLLGSEAMAAAGATNQTLRQMVWLVVFGLSVSTQMLIARYVGGGRIDSAEHVAGQSFLLGLALYAVAALIGVLWARDLVAIVMPDPAVAAPAVIYARVTFLFIFAGIFFQLASAVLNGAGDTTTPMIVTLLITPVSITAEWALAFGKLGLPRLGIAGIALGAAAGSATAMALLLWALFSGRCRVHLRRRHIRPDAAALNRIAGLSWQPALHFLARTAIVFFFMGLAGRLGGEVQAAYTIGLRIELLAVMVAFPIANACATLVGQNLGAANPSRARRSIWVGFGAEAATLWPMAAGIFLFRHDLVSLFTDDAKVQALAAEYLIYSSAILLVYGFYFVAFRALQAAGDMNSPMLISITLVILLGVPLGYGLATQTGLGATGMWIANLIYTVVNAVVMVGWLLAGRWVRGHAAAS